MTTYQLRLLRDLQESIRGAQQMIERDSNETETELMARLPNIRAQCQQAANAASELFGALSSSRYPK